VITQRLHEVIKVDVREQLQHCRIPLLHLYAKHDHLILQGATREIQALRPDIRSVGIDGPHFLLQTRPKECVSQIERFLRDEGMVT
jgi:surfactin synthase thioesterase subunit